MESQTFVYGAETASTTPRAIAATLDQIAYAMLIAFVFVLPWEDAVSLLGGLTISKLIGLAVIGVVLLRTAIWPRNRPLRELHFWMVAFAAWSCASIFWTVDWDSTAQRVPTYLQLLIIAWVIWTVVVSETRVERLLFAYVLGTFVCAVGTIINSMEGLTTGQTGEITGVDDLKTDRYTFSVINPNDLGLLLALSIPMVLFLVSRRDCHPLKRTLCWIQFGLAVPAILLSGSRGATIAACCALLMFPAVLARMAAWQKILASIICAGAAAIGIHLLPAETWQRFLNLGTEITQGTMTHRTQIWSASMQVFRDHAFLGVGSGAHPTAVLKILGRAFVAHNTFVSVLVELGVIGALIFAGLLAAAFHCAWTMRRPARLFWLSTLLTWCVGVLGGTWEYRKMTWLLLSLLVAHAYAQSTERRLGLHNFNMPDSQPAGSQVHGQAISR